MQDLHFEPGTEDVGTPPPTLPADNARMKVPRWAWLAAPLAIAAVIATVVLATPLAGRASVPDGVLPARLHQPWAWLNLIDLATGDKQPLVLDLGAGRWGNRAAFSANGGLVALQGERTAVVATDSTTLWTQDLGNREVLAAFTPDGTRIVTARAQGCVVACSRADVSERRWTFGYRDARSGAPAAGPTMSSPTMSSLTAADVRVLGWSQGLDLVMVRYDAPAKDWDTQAKLSDRYSRAHGHATVVALHPDGTVTTVLDTPPEVTGLEVALNLVEAGRFGGPPATPSPFAANPVVAGIYVGPWIVVIAVATVLIVRAVRRRLAYQRLRAGYSP